MQIFCLSSNTFLWTALGAIQKFELRRIIHCFFVSKKIQAGMFRSNPDGKNRTSSVPSSILRNVVDKGQYFDLEFCLYPVLFPKISVLEIHLR